MKDKKILPYLPARLVKGDNRWYILYYQTNPNTGILKRFRPTYNLNRVHKEKDRIQLAKNLVRQINKELPNGFPFVDADEPKNFPINKALDFFEENKYPAICTDAVRPYKRLVGDIREYLEKKKLNRKIISDFSEIDAVGVMGYIWEKRDISSNTYNRFLKDAIILFNFLIKYKYLVDNPFLAVTKKRQQAAKYRKISSIEKKAIFDYIKEKDYWFYLACSLQYGCFIRPVELSRLKFSHFNFKLGIIVLTPDITKNGKQRAVTIPKDILPLFQNKEFAKNQHNFYVFGNLIEPSVKQVHKELMGKRWRRYIRFLHTNKKLADITDMVFYSLKKTGISDAYKAGIKSEFIRIQAGHSTDKITQLYNEADLINLGMKEFTTGIH